MATFETIWFGPEEVTLDGDVESNGAGDYQNLAQALHHHLLCGHGSALSHLRVRCQVKSPYSLLNMIEERHFCILHF